MDAWNGRARRELIVGAGEIDHHVSDFTASVGASVTLGALQEKLREAGQWIAVDGDESAEIGRLVSENSTGPLRLGFGGWRDLLLGAQFYNGKGELITAGGRTMKNVAGYDLTKLMVGQRGIFGKVATITARTYRLPAGAIHATFAPDPSIVRRLIPTECRPQWAMLTPEALICGYLGDDATLEFYATALRRWEPLELTAIVDLRRDCLVRSALWKPRDGSAFRASVPPSRLLDFTRSLGHSWAADAAFGIVTGSTDEPARIQMAAKSVGGTCSFPQADGSLALGMDGVERAIVERLKLAFDPQGTLTPVQFRGTA